MHRFAVASVLLVCVQASAAIPSSQRDALIAIHAAAGGPSWKNQSGWLGAPETECSWYGVTCDTAQANVIRLQLPDNELSGTISPRISDLPKLQILQLWTNDLQGPLPAEIGVLAELEILDLRNNRLSGQLPSSLGSLDKLVHLALDGNRFSGPLPDALGGLDALEDLEITSNALTGTIPPALASLAHLKILDLSANELEGPIPPALGSMATLETLALAENGLTGGIPRELGGLPSLKRLQLSFNQLEGPIPSDLGQIASLEELNLWGNRLTGHIPVELEGLKAIRKLVLARNRLDGPIPSELFQLDTLEQLILLGNDLNGEISGDIGKLTRLQVLVLSQNKLTGTIPPELSALTRLETLELSDNGLTGNIPPQLGQLTSLVTLDLSGNQLSGPIPRELGDLSALETLTLFSNGLEGPIPADLGRLTNLTMLLLANNRLTGSIPDSLRNLRGLRSWKAHQNALSGPFPSWIGELTSLTNLTFGGNRLTGEIPAGLSGLERLEELDLGGNQLTGSLPDVSRLTQLISFNAGDNRLTGTLPAGIGALTNVEDLLLGGNGFTGSLPPGIGSLTNVRHLDLSNNSFDGAIPELGALREITSLSLGSNRFSGSIPSELGDLSSLQVLDVSRNALRGPLPDSLSRLDHLAAGGSDFSYNALYTNSSSLRAFINAKQSDGDFEATQIVTPSDVRVVTITDRNATLAWTPIRYTWDGGGYQVVASTSSGVPVALATTRSREIDSMLLRGLSPSTSYSFTVTAIAHPHGFQQNLLVSDPSAPVTAATGPRVVAPADVAVSVFPGGLVQIGGTATGTDSFVVTNFGDVSTSITLERSGDFFTGSPEAFTLGGGASQTVTLTSITKPAGTYYGEVSIRENGVAAGLTVRVVLLSVVPPNGTVIAQPVATRIELAGAPGSDSVGTAAFRNLGTAPLTGILLSDQPWVVPASEPITIQPQETGSVSFTLVRAKRPAGVEGALSANLSLIYVNGSANALTTPRGNGTTPQVSVSIVTVVDVTKPGVAPGTIPPLQTGELAFFVPGLELAPEQLRSELSIANVAGSSPINDLRMILSGSSQTLVASLLPLPFQQSVNLIDIRSVYAGFSGIGSMQIRSGNWQSIAAGAKATAVTTSGTSSGSIPVFRSDRSVAAGRSLFLAGVAQPADLFVQETAAAAATVRIEFLSADGAPVATPLEETIGALQLLTLRDAVPSGAVTVVVTNLASSAGRVVAYARVRDMKSSDSWSVVDWSAVHGYLASSAVSIPFADGRGSAPGKRRSVGHAAASTRSVTDVVLFNPGSGTLSTTLRVIEPSGRVVEQEVRVEPRATITILDVGSRVSSSSAHVVIEPLRGELAVTARSHHPSAGGSSGSAIPVLAASSGLRTGQQQIFTSLEDSASFRTSYGLVETAGAPATVRARLIINDASSLVGAVTSRPFQLDPHQQILLPELLRSFAGDARDALGDQHDLTLEIEVTAGDGAVVPFVIVTDNGTGDTDIRVQ